MAQAARLHLRMQKEVKLLLADPPPGASFPSLSAGSDDLSSLHVRLEGPEGSVYAKGIFDLKIQIPERYPFHPPIVTFATPVYHPNIDTGGRICLDILNLPPKGAWQPSLNISTVITSIGLLLSEPNPDDGLMCEASREYKYNRQAFDQKAKAMTEKYAKSVANGPNASSHSIPSFSRLSMEDGGFNMENKKDVADSVLAPGKPHGISKKLSLESSCSTSKMDEKGEEGENLPLQSEKLMQAEISSRESNCTAKYSNGRKKQCGTGRKLSLESSAHIHGKHDHEMGDVASKASKSLCNEEATFVANWGLSPEQLPVCPVKSGQLSEITPLEAPDTCQMGTCEETAITTTEPSTSESARNAATRPHPGMRPVISGELQSPQDSVSAGNHPTDSIVSKVPVARKKLSLGLKGTLRRPEKHDKENFVPVSVLSTGKKVGNGQQVYLGPLPSLQESNGKTRQLLFQPEHFPPKKHQPNPDHTTKAGGKNEQGQGESVAAESAIVLDSEESEEENGRSVRSNSLLARKRAAKRKA